MEAVASFGPFSTSAMVETYAHPPAPSKWDQALFWVARYAGSVLDAPHARRLDKLSERLIERALAMHALGERIEAAEWPTEELDADDQLRGMLHSALDELKLFLVDIEAIQAKRNSVLLAEAKIRCTESARAVAGELEELKGIIQAHDANVTAQRRAAQKPAKSAEEIDQQLDAVFRV